MLLAGFAATQGSCGRPSVTPGSKHLLLPREEGSLDLRAEGIDAARFAMVSNDPATIKILAKGPPPPVGKVIKSGDHDLLEWKGRRVFEAPVIGNVRCRTEDEGIFALEAITMSGGKPLPTKEMDGALPGNPWEVWVVRSDGSSERVSPLGMNATHPVISPNGRHVAFVAEPLVQGFLGIPELKIKDLQEGTIRTYGEKRHGGDYHIVPVDWVSEDGTLTLRVLEDWGETGGHLTLKQVRVE